MLDIENRGRLAALTNRAWPSANAVLELEHLSSSLTALRLDELDTLVLTKTTPGFDKASVDALIETIRRISTDNTRSVKFVVFDFAHQDEGVSVGVEGFDILVGEVADLILKAPIVSVAWARAPMSGADIELALVCSMFVAEQETRFSFAADPIESFQMYGLLAQKIGFVMAERLMESGEPVDVERMRALLLKDIAPKGVGMAGIEQFVRKRGRKHNSAYGIYRAQRMAMPANFGHFPRVPPFEL